MKLLRIIYTGYVLLVFSVIFIILMPFYLVFIQRKAWHKYALFLNHWWARLFFLLSFIPVRIEFRFKPNAKERYVFCPNHFSYLDIPIMGIVSHPFIFVGKSSLSNLPVFGYMYRKLHITVDRESLKSKWTSLLKAKEAIDRGLSVLMFPEGGIRSEQPPKLAAFKDGPFRLAIEKQIPLVPVTIPYNWIILPDNELLMKWKRGKVVYHEPIPTTSLTLEDVDTLKQKVFEIISTEINNHFN